MKRISRSRPLLTSAALVLVALPAGAQRFEGVITAKVNVADQSNDITYSIKGQKMRTDVPMPNGMGTMAMIYDQSAKRMLMLLPANQSYMERAIPDAPAEPDAERAQFAWTGRTETIAGMSCEDATLKTNDGTQYTMCIAKGVTFFGRAGGMGRGGGEASAWQQYVNGGFPLRVQRAGDPQPLMEVISVSRKSLGDDVFSAPSGWQKMSMPMGMPMGRP